MRRITASGLGLAPSLALAGPSGGTPTQQPQRYADASPGSRLPLGTAPVLIWDEHEDFIPHALASAYVARAVHAGDEATLEVVPGAGHFEIASPQTLALPVVLSAIRRLLEPLPRRTAP